MFRVLVLGDSQTYGHGIKDLKDIWVKKLENKLRKEGNDSKIEVLNVSGPGWNTDTQLYELFMNGFRFNPDLVILAYYHNDIPTPTSVNCDSTDQKIIPSPKLIQNSKLIGFVNFKMNRLLETIGRKPSYSDCLNQIYDSIGWEMEKFYLDMMGMSLFVKKIHFMIAVIPVIHQLDDRYPLTGPNQKLKEYTSQRKIEFVDLYETGFKGLDASQLIISKKDNHLNQRAGDIVVDTLFNRIKGLVKYKNLSYFSKAFSLNEILSEYPLLEMLDNRFNQLNSITSFILNSENEAIQVIRNTDQVIFKKIQKEPDGDNPISLLETTLNLSGDFIRQEQVAFYPNSKIPKAREIISKHLNIYTQSIERIKQDSKGALVVMQLGQRTYQFDYEGEDKHRRIKLEKNIVFSDPKILDKWIFQNYYPPSAVHSREKQKELLMGMVTKNPSTINMPDDIKFLTQPGYLDKLSNEEISRNLDERILFKTFLILDRYAGKNYVKLLIELIEKRKPSLMALNAAKRYRLYFTNKKIAIRKMKTTVTAHK